MPGDSYLIPPITTAPPNPTPAGPISRPFPNQAPPRPLSPLPPPHHLHYPPQPIFTAQQPIPIRTPAPQLPKLQPDGSQGVLYPVSSSGRGFVPRPIRPVPGDQTVTVANPGGYPHLPVVTFQSHPMHGTRPPNLQPLPHPVTVAGGSGSIKGVHSGSFDLKVLPPSSGCESNGCKEMRDKARDDTLCIVRDRKVRITEGASLYALCRSWLRNGSQEESQPKYGNFFKSLPRPLPIPMANAVSSQTKEVVEEEDEGDNEEGKGAIENLSPQELLKRHVRRAKRVRSRLREGRLRRIERYKTRLALLLPPPIEQLRTDNASRSCVM